MKKAILTLLLWALAGAPAIAKPLLDTPVLHKDSGSYFELVRVQGKIPGRSANKKSAPWEGVNRIARQRIYMGRRGRLAVVRSRKINNFLRDTFKPTRSTWIGLRYYCLQRRFVWVTGDVLRPGQYRNFGRVWNAGTAEPSGQRDYKCTGTSRPWPVHYWGVQFGFRWNANGSAKYFRFFFVEYPPPKNMSKTE